MRLAPLARREGLQSVWSLLAAVSKQPDSRLAGEMVEALAPRDTWFFRDRAPFAQLAKHALPEAARRAGKNGRIRIWSAGCGDGQEAYSVAMLLEERRARGEPAEAEIVATDFSRAALRRASQGVYNHYEVQRGLPIRRLVEHFDRDGEDWRVSGLLRRMVEFRNLNLLSDFSDLGTFDIVLMRHVLPHMAVEQRASVMMRVMKTLRPEGWLMLGAWETALGLVDGLDPVAGAAGIYRKQAEERADRRKEPRAA
jgi:chemotaxis protein methyltransferase CheR